MGRAILVRDQYGFEIPVLPLGTGSQDVTVGAASAQSNAVGADTRIIALCATTACRIAIGANPTATATSRYLPANVVLYITCLPGEKVAAIQESAGGKLNIVEVG